MEAIVTSRRPHVATSQRRDVTTSRRHNVAKSQRRDVSSRSEAYHLKYGWLRLQRGIGRRTKRGTDFQKQSDTDFEGVLGIVPLFIFFGYFRIFA